MLLMFPAGQGGNLDPKLMKNIYTIIHVHSVLQTNYFKET